MVAIQIDDQTYQVEAGENLLKTALTLGLDLPYFCWHPAMGSVGACRQCAVTQFSDADDRKGRLVMACMTPVSEGMRVSLQNPEAQQFRAGILELLMTNHPHDCPVCEEGGECHLQDMTVMTGHTSRAYSGLKRTHRNQYLGPFINHEMNRCIACYRCIRFYQDYAGGRDLQVLGINNNVYFGRHEEGVLENEFSGNLVEVCPTGVFTDKTLSRSYTRKWDLQVAPSICVHCAQGCNISPGERYGELRRIVNRYNGDVNGYFLCDRGRFGYGFVNSEKRLRKPAINQQPVINDKTAQEHFATLVQAEQGVIGIGSPRASVESNFALRELVGVDNFYQGVEPKEQELVTLITNTLQKAPAHIASLREVEQADAVVILGEDITNTAPRLALSVRQAVRNKAFAIAEQLRINRWLDTSVREAAQKQRSPLIIASCHQTRLDDVASELFRGSPDAIARFGFALAGRLDAKAPEVKNLSAAEAAQVDSAVAALTEASRPLVIVGSGCQSRAVIEAAINLVKSLDAKENSLSMVVPECNSVGLALMGGDNFTRARKRLESGEVTTAVVLENDLYRRADQKTVDKFLAKVEHLVVIDHLHHATMARAELILPAATFAETDGALVSAEGRAQRYFQVLPPVTGIKASWQWIAGVDTENRWRHLDNITAACCETLPALAAIADAAPGAGFRLSGMKVPRQPHRYSGRTAMKADINVSEPKQPEDPDSALAFSMEGVIDNRPPALNPGVWAPAWNSNQAVNKFQDEIAGHLKGGDPGIRLFSKRLKGRWFSKIPKPAEEKDVMVAVPVYHIFGSDELSAHSAPLAERIPEPYVALNSEQAAGLAIAEHDRVELKSGSNKCRVKVKIDPTLSVGSVGIPRGLPGLPVFNYGTEITLNKLPETDRSES